MAIEISKRCFLHDADNFYYWYFLWLVYGVLRQDVAIILANFLTLVFNLVILWLKIKYR